MSRKKSSKVENIISGSFAERLNLLRGEMTFEEFANIIGVLPATLHTYLVGKKDRKPTIPPGDFLVKVCKSTNVDPKWLLIGEGPMYREDKGADKSYPDIWQDPKLFDILHILENDRETKEVIYEVLVGAKHFDRVAKILKKFLVGKIEKFEAGDFNEDPILLDIIQILKDNLAAKHTIYNLLETDVNFDRSLKIVKKYIDEKLTPKIPAVVRSPINRG